jgi:GATA-binding protein
MGTSSPAASMNPTSTEHDFRFPRRTARPLAAAGAARTNAQPVSATSAQFDANDLRSSLLDVKSELSTAFDAAQGDLLNSAAVPGLRDDSADLQRSPEEMQLEDPLAAQVWRFFSKTKQLLPNQERLENLTWRMMAMNLRKRREEEDARYVCMGRLTARTKPWHVSVTIVILTSKASD